MMDKVLVELMRLMQPTAADWFIFFMGLLVVTWIIGYIAVSGGRRKALEKRIKDMEDKYHILDKHNLYLWSQVDPDGVRMHHSGEHYMVHPSERVKHHSE